MKKRKLFMDLFYVSFRNKFILGINNFIQKKTKIFMKKLLYHQKAIEKWGYRNIFFVFKCYIKFSLVIFDPKNYDFLSVSAEFLDNLSKNLVKKTKKKTLEILNKETPFWIYV